MQKHTSVRRRTMLRATTACVLTSLVLGVSPTTAQEQEDDSEFEDLETVIVTGSRIQRRGFEDISQPAVVLDNEVFDQRGFTNVADALNQIPGFGAGITGFNPLDNSGQNVGQEFLNLFGLGTQRTLVLVNGRRFVTGNVLSAAPLGRAEGFQVDINNFAPALIERVETLSIGGAPIYGSDAIAGTVNFITKDDFEGVDLSFQYENFAQDGFETPTYTINGLFGANTGDGRGNVTLAFQFEDEAGNVTNDFPRLAFDADILPNGGDPFLIAPGGVDGEARFNILEGPAGFLLGVSGVPLPNFGANLLTDAGGNLLTFNGETPGLSIFDPGNPIVDGVQTSSATLAVGGNGFDTDDFFEAQAPVQRFVVSGTTRYDLTENVRLFAEGNFLSSSSSRLINQSEEAFNTAFLGTQGIGAFGLSTSNPFISPEDQATIQSALTAAGADPDTVFLNGIHLGLLPDAGATGVDTTTFRVLGGVKGDFSLADRKFDWEVSYSFGETKQVRTEAIIVADNFFNAVDVVELTSASITDLVSEENLAALAATTGGTPINVVRNGEILSIDLAGDPTAVQVGDIVCNAILSPSGPIDQVPDSPTGTTGIAPFNTATPDPSVNGCVPTNLFLGFNTPPEAVDFLTAIGTGIGVANQADLVANLGGEAFDLPAGPVFFNIGVERRREFGSFTSGGLLEAGLSRAPAEPSVPQVEIVSNEYFAEVDIPVLSEDFNLGINDLFGFELITALNFNGAYRRINTSIDVNENVYSAGGRLSLLDNQLTFRGNFTRSVRTPSLIELFAPPAQTFDQTGDPCDVANIFAAPGSNRIANCVTAAQDLGFTDAVFVDGEGLILDPTNLDAAGDPVVFTTPSVNAAIPLSSEGNPDLINETAISWTAGFNYAPSFAPGLVIGFDYVTIRIDDLIVEPDFTFFTENCFDLSDFAAGAIEETCGNFFRTPASFDIVTGTTAFINSGPTGPGSTGRAFDFRAIQGQIRYNFEVEDFFNLVGLNSYLSGDFGSIDFRGTFFAPLVNGDSSDDATDPVGGLTNTVGSNLDTELTFILDINYTFKRFGMSWRILYEDNDNPCFFRIEGDCDDIPAFAFQLPRDVQADASISYQITDGVGVRVGATDIFGDRQTLAQQAFNEGGNPTGRTVFGRLNVSF